MDDKTNIERRIVIEEIAGQPVRVIEKTLRAINGGELLPEHDRLLDVFGPVAGKPKGRPATPPADTYPVEATAGLALFDDEPARRGPGRPPRPVVVKRDARGRHLCPSVADMKRLLERHNGSAVAIAEALDVPRESVGNWLYQLRSKGKLPKPARRGRTPTRESGA